VGTGDGIECGTGAEQDNCAEMYPTGTEVTLTATPAFGFEFGSWNGDCDAAGSVVMNDDAACGASFNPLPPQTLTVNIVNEGGATGTVTSTPAGITCPGDCSEPFAFGTEVRLDAVPDTGFFFDGWQGCGPNVTVTGPLTCTAVFSADAPVRPATPVPTMSFWGLVALGGAVGLLGAFARRRRG
jgi:hypothetical protein